MEADEYVQFLLDSTPPQAVTDLTVSLAGNLLLLQWAAVTTDTAGGSESIQYYVIYRDEAPDFAPTAAESLGSTPATGFADSSVFFSPMVNFYYLVRAVDATGNKSSDSGRVGEFDRELSALK